MYVWFFFSYKVEMFQVYVAYNFPVFTSRLLFLFKCNYIRLNRTGHSSPLLIACKFVASTSALSTCVLDACIIYVLFNALICISKKNMGENEHGRLSNIILDTNSSKGTTLIVDDLHFTVTVRSLTTSKTPTFI